MSKFRDKREAFKQRAEQGVKDRQKSAGKYSVVHLGKIDNINFFKPNPDKQKRNLIDIIPFFVTQNWTAKMRGFNGDTLGVQIGDMLYKLEVPIHGQGCGALEFPQLCLKSAFGKACPVCDDRESLKEDSNVDEDIIGTLYPRWKVYYNLRDKNEPDKTKRRKVWESPYHSFEKFFLDEADMGTEGYVIFADPEEGKTIKFKGRKKHFKSKGGQMVDYLEAESIEFIDRKRQYMEDDIKKSISFDKYLAIPTYEEVEKAYLGTEDDSEKGAGKKKKEK